MVCLFSFILNVIMIMIVQNQVKPYFSFTAHLIEGYQNTVKHDFFYQKSKTGKFERVTILKILFIGKPIIIGDRSQKKKLVNLLHQM